MKKIIKFALASITLIATVSVVGVNTNAATTPSQYFDQQYYTQNIPSGYYNNVNTSLTDADFRRNLSTIISAGYKQHSYKANNEVLTYTDPDPSGNGNIICLYTGQSMSSGWNKEHVWAKSHGFPQDGYSGSEPYSDAHHLRPTYTNINSTRGNLDFGEVSGGSSDSYGNRWGGGHFEPRDAVKGDVARMMFYMATRYGFDQFKLTLVNDSTTSGSSLNGRFGNLQTLLKWHYQDPVSKEEIYRNNIIYQFYQKNRNPYIDHPEYVDYAYPNSYSSSQTVDEAKVNNVISLIGSLPSTVTLDDKAQITAAQTAYNALNSLEKQRVVNYAELQRCLDAIAELEAGGGNDNPNPTPTPDVPTTQGDIVIDFNTSSGVTNAYKPNVNFTASDKDFYASYAGQWSGDNGVRIGYNKSAEGSKVLDSKLGLSGYGAYLEPQFDVTNLKSMKLSVSDGWGNGSWYVLFKASGSNTYTQVATGSHSNSAYEITASLSTPANGRFVMAFVGDTPRAIVSSLSLYTGTGGGGSVVPSESFITSFVKQNTTSSLKLDYDTTTGEVVDADLRFGARIQASAYNASATYGIVILDDTELASFFEAGEVSGETSVSHYVGDEYAFELTPVRVNQYGVADSNGDYYQFSCVITNMEAHYSTDVLAVIYVEYNNKLYFAKLTTDSLSDCASRYVASGNYEGAELTALKSLFE